MTEKQPIVLPALTASTTEQRRRADTAEAVERLLKLHSEGGPP